MTQPSPVEINVMSVYPGGYVGKYLRKCFSMFELCLAVREAAELIGKSITVQYHRVGENGSHTLPWTLKHGHKEHQ